MSSGQSSFRIVNCLPQALILIVLVCIVFAFAIPGILAVRESPRRHICDNNLKAIILATHSHAETQQKLQKLDPKEVRFPSGTIANQELAPDRRLSWYVTLLPYLEQEVLFKKINTKRAWDSPVNSPSTKSPIAWLVCPGLADAAPLKEPYYTCYIGVAGLGEDAHLLPEDHFRAGIFGYDRSTRWEAVTDGLGNTMMIIESAQANGGWAQGGVATVRGLHPEEKPYFGKGRPFGGTHYAQRFSRHRGQVIGFSIALADGTVRHLKESVSSEIIEALATIARGEQIPEDW